MGFTLAADPRWAAVAWAMLASQTVQAQSIHDLRDMSLESLTTVEISSVAKAPQSLGDAAAAVFVISHDDIARSGARSVPEMLRLAPNLEVFQTSASRYVITARGFSGNTSAQSFSNKLLVLIDGRSVYTPLYSGVYWDMQDVLAEDIERIEVISGPGATLWGANAVNGVINIITRKAADSRSLLVDAGGGNGGQYASVRYGGRIGGSVDYRVYAKAFRDTETRIAAGAPAGDDWFKPQAGFRIDYNPSSRDSFTLQGDGYAGSESQAGGPDEDITGVNLLGRWNRTWQSGDALQVQAYYDRAERATESDGGKFVVNTYDIDVQHSFTPSPIHSIVWGGGLRISHYDIYGTASLFFVPVSRDLKLANAFVQDSIALGRTLTLTLGLKVEDDPYSQLSLMPSARLAWKPGKDTLFWAAASRAVRSPTPFDRDIVEKLGPTVFLVGSSGFRNETLNAFEAGLRTQPVDRASLSVSVFYNIYDDLRSIEPTPGTFLPLYWGNGLRGETYGLEAWAAYNVTSWWKLSPSVSVLEENFRIKPGASALTGISQIGDDPEFRASLRSSMNIGRAFTVDADLRYVGPLPNPRVASYVELGAHIAWNVSRRLQLSIIGQNLLHEQHQEFPAPQSFAAVRRISAGLTWRP